MFALLGILSGIVFIIADLPYLKDTLADKTRPHRVSWFLYFVFNSLSIANQAASGATNSLWLPAAGALMTFIIFVVSFKHGVGGHEKLDIICLAGALIGVGLWIAFNEPLYSIVANLIATGFAVAPTIKKSYLKPHTETSITYLIAAVSCLLSALSVGKWDWVLLLLPVYSLIVQAGIYFLLIGRRRALSKYNSQYLPR